jgi:hypothetical protein
MRKVLVLAVAVGLLMWAAMPVLAQARAEGALRVWDLGPDDAVHQALALIPGVGMVADPADADAIVVHNAPLTAAQAQAVAAAVQGGTGLVLLLGPDLPDSFLGLILGQGGALTPQDLAQSATLTPSTGADDPLLDDINWNSAPQVRERSALPGAGLEPLVVTEAGETVVGRQGPVTVVTAWLSGEHNSDLQEWRSEEHTSELQSP